MSKRILSWLLVLVMVLGMIPIMAGAETATPEIAKTNMALDSVLNVNFKVDFKGIDPSGYSLRVTVGDTVTEITEYTQEYDLYVYTAELLAHKMGQTVTAELLNGETVVDTMNWTVSEYVDKLQELYPNETEMNSLTAALENYGAYAAYYAGEAEDPALSAVQGITPDLEKYKQDIVVSGLKVSAYLYLDEACDIGLKFNTADMEGKTLYVDGTAVETSALNDTQMGYRIANILPQDYGTAYNIVVKDSDSNTVFEVNYSVFSYIRQALNQSTELKTGLNGLLKAMYLYNQAADTYQTYLDTCVSLTFRDGGTNRLIYISETTPTLNVDFFVTEDLEGVAADEKLSTDATVYVNGKAHTATLTYQKEDTTQKGYIQLAVTNPKGWTPTKGDDNYKSDPSVTLDLLIPAGISLGTTGKQTSATRYLLYKAEGLDTSTAHPRRTLTAETADPEDYEIINYVNVTQFRYTRAIYMNKTTPTLDNLDFFVDAVLSETNGATVAEGVTVYVDGVAYNVNITYNTAGYITLSAIDNPGSWTPVEGDDDYASDPAVTFDLLIPEGTTFSNGYVLENAARYLITKPVSLHTTATHPRQECTAEVADADEYVCQQFTVTGVNTGTRALALDDGRTRLDLYLNVDTAIAEANTTVSNVSLYINGKEYVNDVIYQVAENRLQISIYNPIGWEPSHTNYATDPAATFDILLPAGTVLNGYALTEPARCIVTKTAGMTDPASATYYLAACSGQVADAADYELVDYVEVTDLRTAGGSSRAIVPDKTNAPDVGRLDLYFLIDTDLGDNNAELTTNATVYINGKAHIVDTIYYGETVNSSGVVTESFIRFSVLNPTGWEPYAGEDTYATDPAVTFDTLIPAGTQLGSYTLAKSARYLLSKTEGLSQNDNYPRKALTGTTANAGDYEYAYVNVTGFNYTRAIYNSTKTPQLNLEFKVDKVLANTTENTEVTLYTVASGVTVYVNGQAHTVDINYNSEKGVIAITVSNPVGWTPYAGDDSYASDPAATFDVLIPAGIEFTDENVLQNAARYIITKPVGLELYSSVHYVNTACTGEVADAEAYELVNYASITGYRNGRALYYNQEYTRLDNLCFFVDTELAEADTVVAENVLVYINGEGRLTNITYKVEERGAKYIELYEIANVAGWTPEKGDDDYASDPTVTFDILIPAGTDLGNYKLDKSVRYIATKGGLTASNNHRLCWMSTADGTQHPYDYVYSGIVEGQYIVEDGATAYAIVYPASADTQTANAASELELRFEEATGTDIVIYKDSASIPAGTKLISVGNTSYATAALSSTSVEEEGYRITTVGTDIYVLGDGYGVLEGTYELLNDLFDYEFYKAGVVAGTDNNASDVYTLNTGVTNLTFKNIDKSAAPEITYMPTNYHGLRETDHYRYTFNNEGALVAGTSSTRWHNTFVALDPETYGSKHADWYYTKTTGILWWEDTQNIQLCYTAHGDETERQAMIDTAVDYYVALLQEYPTRSYISFSMEDNAMWCSCDACNDAKKTYGANSGAMLVMASKIRTGIMEKLAATDDTRDIKVLAMIYSSCEDLPVVENSDGSYEFDADFLAAADAEGLKNIVPVWATMATKDHAKGWNDSANANARTMMAQLNALFDEFWVWDYGVNFHDYLLPINTFDTLSADMQYLASQEHLKLYLYQADHTAGNTTGFGGLRTYLMSALRWDADQDIDTLIDNYFAATYGSGAAAMKQIYSQYLALSAANEGTWEETIYSDTMLQVDYWPQETVAGWLELIDEAKTAAADDAVALENITVESIFVRYIYAVLYTEDEAFETELCNDVNKYFTLIREGASYTADTLENKL